MSGPEFFQTGMGRKFYESDVPRSAEALERIAKALERIAAKMEADDTHTYEDERKGAS